MFFYGAMSMLEGKPQEATDRIKRVRTLTVPLTPANHILAGLRPYARKKLGCLYTHSNHQFCTRTASLEIPRCERGWAVLEYV
jgi:hypothetical protein